MAVTHGDLKRIEDITVDLLRGMKLSLHPEVSADTEAVRIKLVGDDTSIIIGFHGETLADFSYILGIMVRHQVDKDFVLRIDAGDYMKNKDARTESMALEAIKKVQTSGFPERLTGLNSYERRLVHSIADREGLTSDSTGVGKERVLIIKPKSGE